jgi:hypothetical protein
MTQIARHSYRYDNIYYDNNEFRDLIKMSAIILPCHNKGDTA